MDDKPATAWLWYLIGIWALTGVALVMLGTGMARAQEQCPPLERLVTDLGEKYGEQIIWEGTVPTQQGGAFEAMLFQSEKSWTFVIVQGISACVVAAGTDSNPPLGKGV
jgi:hypothetical protein